MATTYLPTPTYDEFEAIDAERDGDPGLVRTVVRRYLREGVGTQAAGIGLFTLTALPATLLALAAIYGLIAAPDDVTGHVAWIAAYVPFDTYAVISPARRACLTISTPHSLVINGSL